MTRPSDLPSISDELAALLEAERSIPAAPEGLAERVAERLAATLGWGGGGGGAGLALAPMVLAALLAIGGVAGVVWMSSAGDAPEAGGERDRRDPGATPLPRSPRPGDPGARPAWFGEPTRPEREVAGVVVFAGEPVAGARVAMTSTLTRIGLEAPAIVTTGSDGRFSFGAAAAATYDVTASKPGMGFGVVRVEVHDPGAEPGDLYIALSGCEHRLRGVVRDASGGVVAGATVSWTSGNWLGVVAVEVGATTGSDGRYELCTRRGRVTTAVAAQGYGALNVVTEVNGVSERDITLVPEAALAGRVVDGAGRPIAGAAVFALPSRWWEPTYGASAASMSDPGGRFRIAGLVPGRHRVWAETASDKVRAIEVVIGPGEEAEVELVLSGSPSVSGVVMAGGGPVAGARVTVLEDARARSATAVADRAGRFRVVLPRPMKLSFEVLGFEVLEPGLVDVTAGSVTGVVVAAAPAAAIRGRVVRGGRPVFGARVVGFGPGPRQRRWAQSDREGRFELRGADPGPWKLSARSDAEAAFSIGEVEVEVSRGSDTDNVRIELDGAASISGTVIDSGGAPVAGVIVKYTADRGDDLCRARTGAGGEFRCAMLVGGGRYTAVVQPGTGLAAFAPAGGAHPAVEVPGGDSQVSGQVLEIVARRGIIGGRVVSASGAPLADIAVRAAETPAGINPTNNVQIQYPSAITGAAGRFELEVWSDTRYALFARAPRGGRARPVEAEAGDEVTVIFERPGVVRGELIGFEPSPEVLIRQVGNNNNFIEAQVRGDRFEVEGVAPGRYAILVAGGADGATRAIEVAPDSEVSVTIEARPRARLEGRVTDVVSGEPVSGVRCRAVPYEKGAGIAGWGIWLPDTGADGRFAAEIFSGLLEVYCLRDPARHSEGAARVTAAASRPSAVEIPVVVSPVPFEGANTIGARFLYEQEQNRIVQLRSGGAAEAAGLRVGDVIVAIDGRDVRGLTDGALGRLIGTYERGDRVRVGVVRGGAARALEVLVEGPWRW